MTPHKFSVALEKHRLIITLNIESTLLKATQLKECTLAMYYPYLVGYCKVIIRQDIDTPASSAYPPPVN